MISRRHLPTWTTSGTSAPTGTLSRTNSPLVSVSAEAIGLARDRRVAAIAGGPGGDGIERRVGDVDQDVVERHPPGRVEHLAPQGGLLSAPGSAAACSRPRRSWSAGTADSRRVPLRESPPRPPEAPAADERRRGHSRSGRAPRCRRPAGPRAAVRLPDRRVRTGQHEHGSQNRRFHCCSGSGLRNCNHDGPHAVNLRRAMGLLHHQPARPGLGLAQGSTHKLNTTKAGCNSAPAKPVARSLPPALPAAAAAQRDPPWTHRASRRSPAGGVGRRLDF